MEHGVTAKLLMVHHASQVIIVSELGTIIAFVVSSRFHPTIVMGGEKRQIHASNLTAFVDQPQQ